VKGSRVLLKSSRRSLTILLIDDEPAILSLQRALFETLGYSVLTAGSDEEALTAMQAHPFDAVVLDYLMPTMDVEETARRIRKAHGNVPIVVTSALKSLPGPLAEIVDASVEKERGLVALVREVEKLLPPVN